jgi:hypothetical protein
LFQLKKFYEFEVTLEEMAYLADFLPQDACTISNFTTSTTQPMNTTTTRNPTHDGSDAQTARTWISNIICCGLFVLNVLRSNMIVDFVDMGRIVDHDCLNFILFY